MEKREWAIVTTRGLASFIAGTVIFVGALLWFPRGFIPVLDHANLIFHEAGHPAANLISPSLQPYGGTICQLVFPLILICNFWQRGSVHGFAVGLFWLFENFLNIARYVADARTMALPLVGGGDHDWNTILRHWNLLQYDTQIAMLITIGAWVGIAATCAWVFSRAHQSRNVVLVSG
jgi:hypothetical protein